MLQEESRVTLFQDYVTVCLKILAESYVTCHGGTVELPSFMGMTHIQEKPPSAQEIIDHVRKVFSEG